MEIKDAVVIRVKELCDEKNITTNSLAARSGLTPSTVYSMLKKERRDISIIVIAKLCNGLGVTVEEFFHAPVFLPEDNEK